jgi:hypothetical protein
MKTVVEKKKLMNEKDIQKRRTSITYLTMMKWVQMKNNKFMKTTTMEQRLKKFAIQI